MTQPHLGWYSRGYLPHLDRPGLVQMVTFRLADSLPSTIDLGTFPTPSARVRALDAVLDKGYGRCVLRLPHIASVVEKALRHFDGERYALLAWVIMPNHVHALLETRPGYPVPAVVQSWKSYTAKEANQLMGTTGRFWQREYFDRAIRDERHLAVAVNYVEGNPVKAGLASAPEAWPFSSARFREPSD